jgi:hypothetical protein
MKYRAPTPMLTSRLRLLETQVSFLILLICYPISPSFLWTIIFWLVTFQSFLVFLSNTVSRDPPRVSIPSMNGWVLLTIHCHRTEEVTASRNLLTGSIPELPLGGQPDFVVLFKSDRLQKVDISNNRWAGQCNNNLCKSVRLRILYVVLILDLKDWWEWFLPTSASSHRFDTLTSQITSSRARFPLA